MTDDPAMTAALMHVLLNCIEGSRFEFLLATNAQRHRGPAVAPTLCDVRR
jgi:hypothetical protein